ncbi:hypothetical protein ACOMHN_024920 [Nucella lapillus]
MSSVHKAEERQRAQQLEAEERQRAQQLEAEDRQRAQQLEAEDRQRAQQLEAEDRQRAQQLEAEDRQRAQQLEAEERQRAQQLEAEERQRAQQLEAEERQRAQQLEAEERQRAQQLELRHLELEHKQISTREGKDDVSFHGPKTPYIPKSVRLGCFYPQCREARQSPINIQTSMTRALRVPDFNLSGYRKESDSFELHNDGGHHSVKVAYEGSPITITGGGLKTEYMLDQFHFHWGSTDYKGSEHLVNGKPSPLELVADENKDFEDLLKKFKDITYTDTSTELKEFSLADLLPKDAGSGGFYQYWGSLTTPPCSGNVMWTVFEEKIKIASKQLEEFRSLQTVTEHEAHGGNHPLWDNNRHVRHLDGRTVYYRPAGTN